jgi:hypothetical protein
VARQHEVRRGVSSNWPRTLAHQFEERHHVGVARGRICASMKLSRIREMAGRLAQPPRSESSARALK